MDMNKRPHIPRQQTLTREMTRQHNTVVFFNIDPFEEKSASCTGQGFSGVRRETGKE
jgi:hypothetical protein